jgi:hypothetical protein
VYAVIFDCFLVESVMVGEELGLQAAESPLAPAILRGLGDRSYDKRKNAALEIEALVRSLSEARDTDRCARCGVAD